jgi:hypothetical protein
LFIFGTVIAVVAGSEVIENDKVVVELVVVLVEVVVTLNLYKFHFEKLSIIQIEVNIINHFFYLL